MSSGCIIFLQKVLQLTKRLLEEDMATDKRVFTLRLQDEVFDKIGILATNEHRSMTNYIEYVLLKHITEIEKDGEIKSKETK